MSKAWLSTLTKYEQSGYESIALNELIVLTVFTLAEQRREITFEDIVAASYTMFPSRFALRGYPDWPDSTVANKRWLDCRDRGFILGSTKDGFSITAKGLVLVEKTRKSLNSIASNSGLDSRFISEQRTRAGRFVRSIETSEGYRLFKADGVVDNISEFDFRSLLLCTMEGSGETLRGNIEQLKQFISVYSRTDLAEFLHLLEKKFAGLLHLSIPNLKVIRGGMVPRHKKR